MVRKPISKQYEHAQEVMGYAFINFFVSEQVQSSVYCCNVFALRLNGHVHNRAGSCNPM
jgi:hypothetical protein